MRRWGVLGVVLAVGIAGAAAVTGMQDLAPAAATIPTTRAIKGDIDVRVHTLGELAPHRSMSLSAPSVGGMLQIVTLATGGSVVKNGDVVTEFDRAWYSYGPERLEHAWARVFARIPGFTGIENFGSSDCHCDSHLFYNAQEPDLEAFRARAGGEVAVWRPDLSLA